MEPAFYDHEDHAPTRERRAADWGADEVFASVPRRRFRGERSVLTPSAPSARPHVGAPAARSSEWRALPVTGPPEAAGPAIAPDEQAAPAPAPAEPMPADDLLTSGVAFEPPATAWVESPEPRGRRTVVVTGRPGGAPVQPRRHVLPAERRRPPRSVSDRVGGRPDRVAGWSFGMGLLLIVVAAFS